MSQGHRRAPPPPELEDAAWTARARPLDVVLCDAVFRVADDLYVGPEDGFTPREWEEARVALLPPALPCRVPGWVATIDLLDREDELIAYYGRLVAAAGAHGKGASLRTPSPYFVVKPVIIGLGEALASFPWSDGLRDTRPVLGALAASGRAAKGCIWDDVEQSWRIRIVAAGGTTCFVEWDGEGPPPADAGWVVDTATLARQAVEALARLCTTHDRLTRALGRNHWP